MATNIPAKLNSISSQYMFPNIRKIKQNIDSINSAINSNSAVLNDQSVPLIDSVISKYKNSSNFSSIHGNYASSITAIEIMSYLNELKQLMQNKRAVGNYLKTKKTESTRYNSNSNNTRTSYGPIKTRPQSPRFGGRRRKTRRSRR